MGQMACDAAQRPDQHDRRALVVDRSTGASSLELSDGTPTVGVITVLSPREHDERGPVAARGSGGDVVQLLVRVPPELADELKAAAAEEDRSVAATVRTALKAYLAERQATPTPPEQRLRMTGS